MFNEIQRVVRVCPLAALFAFIGGVLSFQAASGQGSAPAADRPGTPAHAEPLGSTDDVCAKLAHIKLDHVEIETARSQVTDAPVEGVKLPGMTGNPGEGPPVRGLPAFCRIGGRIHPEAGSDIHFEVWMPSAGWYPWKRSPGLPSLKGRGSCSRWNLQSRQCLFRLGVHPNGPQRWHL